MTRRALADLPLEWATTDAITKLSQGGAGLPERTVALAAFHALPTESNLLFTGYVDLRAAEVEQAAPATLSQEIRSLPASMLPEGAAAIIEISSAGIGAFLGAEATAAGLGVTPLSLSAPLAGASEDRTAALIAALWNTGVAITLNSGRLSAPIIIRVVAPEAGSSLLARIAVQLGEGAHASIVEEISGSAAAAGVATSLLATSSEVTLGARATLSLSSIQDLPEDRAYVSVRRHTFGEKAQLQLAVAQVGARLVRGRIDHLLEGDGSGVRQVEVVFGAGDQIHDLTTYSLHSGQKTVGDLLAKGVFAGNARGYIKGVTTIPRSGRGTNSYLGEFGMLLSKTARSVAIPSLWIDQPDCERAAHGSSVGPIDPAQIFYLRSRGLTDAEARRTIVMGFLEPVVAALPLEAEAERLREVLAIKLDGALAKQPAALAS
ncbi:MAG: SufD family Fe-S cluster assembly protein [bacterium]